MAEESTEERKAARKGYFPSSMGLSFLATLYPSYRAAGTDPVQVLRYE